MSTFHIHTTWWVSSMFWSHVLQTSPLNICLTLALQLNWLNCGTHPAHGDLVQYVRPTARRSVHPCSARCNFVPVDLGTFEELCRAADERLFNSIVGNKHHVLHHLLPPKSEASKCYTLRPHTHNFRLPERSHRLQLHWTHALNGYLLNAAPLY